MPKAFVIHEKGAPSVMQIENVETPRPGPGEIRIRHTAIGVNFVDTYHRRGIDHPLPVPDLPTTIGVEGTGIVEELGEGVDFLNVGQRVAYGGIPPIGSYCEERIYPAKYVVPIPEEISDVQAAAGFVKGMTAQYLIRRTFNVKKGDWVVVQAAAGGMGLILCQWLNYLGANIIATTSTQAKADLARQAGAHHTILYRDVDWVEEVRKITNGRGVDVVYDSVGKDTLRGSLKVLKTRGWCVCYGHASGEPEPVDIINELATPGSLILTRPALVHYTEDREELVDAAKEWFDVLQRGVVKLEQVHVRKFDELPAVHAELEGGGTVGTFVVMP